MPGVFDAIALVEDVNGTESTLVLWPSTGAIWVRDVDLGYPEVRAAMVDRVGGSGSVDYTSSYGPSAVSITLAVIPTPGVPVGVTMDAIRAWLVPSRRPRLVYTPTGSLERQMPLRPGSLANPLPMAVLRGGRFATQIQFVNSAGVASDTASYSVTLYPDGGLEGGLRAYPLVYPRVYSTLEDGPPGSQVVGGGNTPAAPVIRIYGECQAPTVYNDTYGWSVGLPGLFIGSEDDYVDIDIAAQTARLNGSSDPVDNVRGTLVMSEAAPTMGPINRLRFTGSYLNDTARAVITWYPAWI